jgi:hypothetical protein
LWRKKLAQETESGNSHHEAKGRPVFLPVNILQSQPSKSAIAEGRIDTANTMPVLQITTPCGFLINVTHISTTEMISQTLAAINQLGRETSSCSTFPSRQ